MAPRREVWITGPRAVELRTGPPLPAPGPGQIVARALASGVSQGTELLLFRGEGPTPFDPSLDEPGAPTYPRRTGYAWVGEVVGRSERVFALAPHGDEHILPADRVRTIPDAVPAPRAVLAASLETAITVVWDAAIVIGDDVVVLGGGVVGLLAAWVSRRAGAGRVRLIEPSGRRRAAARALGIAETRTPEEDGPAGDADVVVEATGDPASLDRAIAHARPEGTVVIASFYGERRAPVGLGSRAHRARLTLRHSQVATPPPRLAPRWDAARRFELVRVLLAEPVLDALLDPPVSIDRAAEVYARLDADPGASLQTVFAYSR